MADEETTIIEPKTILVTVIATEKKVALVEYLDGDMPVRASVPLAKIANGAVLEDDLAKATKVGVRWADAKMPALSATDFQRELRKRGLWTAEDALSNPRVVQNIIMRTVAPAIRSALRQAAGK